MPATFPQIAKSRDLSRTMFRAEPHRPYSHLSPVPTLSRIALSYTALAVPCLTARGLGRTVEERPFRAASNSIEIPGL
jgi:hypothetical protein